MKRLLALQAALLLLACNDTSPTPGASLVDPGADAVRGAQSALTPTFDCENGNAAVQFVIPSVVPLLLSRVSPGDAPIVLRTTTVISNSWFDAIAPYADQTVGVYSSIPRRPVAERTNCNRNIALLHASYQALVSLMPEYQTAWAQMLTDAGLDANDTSTDTTTAVGIGNVAGNGVATARANDGMNQLGELGGADYHRVRYSDYTGYEPVNTAYDLEDARRWQPDILTNRAGIFSVQQMVTPQLGQTMPYSYEEPYMRAPTPSASYGVRGNGHGPTTAAYRAQANQVLAAQAALTDEQKMKAEFFDDKIRSLGFSMVFILQSRGLSLEEFVEIDFLTNAAAWDTMITIWENKVHFDAVRPFSAIEYIYGDSPVTAWGGPGVGTVNDMRGSDWRPYLQSANHPEYPSASASFCRAHSTAARLYLGSNTFGWEVPAPAGSSIVEPGITPAADLTMSFPTWDDFSYDCGVSRNWAGVHFMPSIPAGQAIGDPIGERVYAYVDAHIRGDLAAIEAIRNGNGNP